MQRRKISPALLGQQPRPAANTGLPLPDLMLVSHERSGTHFLMNALSAAYGYPTAEYLDFDQNSLPINFFEPNIVAEVLGKVGVRRGAATIVKSHHSAEFFGGVLDAILKNIRIFYIHRDPVDVMISFWRFINRWEWREGPRRQSALEFAAAEPEGQMMRYQMRQERNLLQRWAHHVDGWTAAAVRHPQIVVVRYDELKDRYEDTISSFSELIGQRPGSLLPPSPTVNVIAGVPADRLQRPDREALRALALAEVGETMRRHGYA